jgi:hypothetical protein
MKKILPPMKLRKKDPFQSISTKGIKSSFIPSAGKIPWTVALLSLPDKSVQQGGKKWILCIETKLHE